MLPQKWKIALNSRNVVSGKSVLVAITIRRSSSDGCSIVVLNVDVKNLQFKIYEFNKSLCF